MQLFRVESNRERRGRGRRSRFRPAAAATACALAMVACSLTAGADTIDFGEVHQWTDPNTLTETYVFPTGTVIVTIDDPSGSLSTAGGPPAGPSPATNLYLNPPDNAANNANPESLFLRTFGNGTGTDALVITIEFMFPYGATDVQFDIFDVDRTAGEARDSISLSSTDFNTAATSGPTGVLSVGGSTPVWRYSSGNGRVRGVSEASGGSGNTTDAGTARVEFMGGSYSRIEIEIANDDRARGDQWISLSDISFIPLLTPEPSAAQLLLAGLLILAGYRRRRS